MSVAFPATVQGFFSVYGVVREQAPRGQEHDLHRQRGGVLLWQVSRRKLLKCGPVGWTDRLWKVPRSSRNEAAKEYKA